jgi:hypothetical protein
MCRVSGYLVVLAVLGVTAPLRAQWFIWTDPETGIDCDLINAENARFVLSDQSGNLIRVTGADRELINTTIDDAGQVIIENVVFGLVEFARDANGKRRLFWASEFTGALFSLEEITGQPILTNVLPEQVAGDCDACAGFWDIDADCGGDSGSGADAGEVPPVDTGAALGAALFQGLCGTGGVGLIGILLVSLLALRLARPRV